jgi:hypothetical protein
MALAEQRDIDAIEHVEDTPGRFVYRLSLSTSAHFAPDQPVTFQSRRPNDTIPAIVVRCDDEGLVVECEKPLPTDAKLLGLSFDPVFILRALENFVVEMARDPSAIAYLLASKDLPPLRAAKPRRCDGLNDEQGMAVAQMSETPLHMLWGPPGTGKTTTIGAAVVEWLRCGKGVLIVSTSNAAVDVAMKAVLKRVSLIEKQTLLRLGTSLDPEVRQITFGGKLSATNARLAALVIIVQYRLRQIRDLIACRNVSAKELQALFDKAAKYEKQIAEFNEMIVSAMQKLKSGVPVTGCTLARMVLDPDDRKRRFDVVVLDEASMASLLYAFAASLLASTHLIYACDPKQLPPIVQADGQNAAKWFGQNVCDWFEVAMDDGATATKLSLLRTQYRMTNQIGATVSRLSYSGLLKHGRGVNGPQIQFVDICGDWEAAYYSVQESSYYHLAAVPILTALSQRLGADEVLMLSPFRPQRSLLAALAFDLRRSARERKALASTIHRSQGSEAGTVVVDLTTHSPERLVAFFRDKHSSNLFNVAISRAKDRLVILGSRSMIRALAKSMPFWERVVHEVSGAVDVMSCEEAIDGVKRFDLASMEIAGTNSFPAIYCHARSLGPLEPGVELLKGTPASRKLLVLPDAVPSVEGDFIICKNNDCPSLFIGGGHVCLPFRGKWLAVDSPNVSRVIWRIGFSHFADEEIDPLQARRFFCPECATGELVMHDSRGTGWFLVCTNAQVHECYYRRRLSLEDAKLKVRLQGLRCPKGHPLTARQGPRGMFIGCENYPECNFDQSLSLLNGV